MDFRVYHYGARGVFDGTRPVYGPASGLGWPLHYRYPPLFLLLFAPLSILPLNWGAAVWVLLKVVVLILLLRAMTKRMAETRKPDGKRIFHSGRSCARDGFGFGLSAVCFCCV